MRAFFVYGSRGAAGGILGFRRRRDRRAGADELCITGAGWHGRFLRIASLPLGSQPRPGLAASRGARDETALVWGLSTALAAR